MNEITVEKIKKLREVMLISQGELADILGESIVTVDRLVNSKFESTIKIKRKSHILFNDNKIQSEDK